LSVFCARRGSRIWAKENEVVNYLVTNDDGITAPGLWQLVRCLRTLGRVLVVAPNGNYSGYGAALPPARELSFRQYRLEASDLAGVTAYALSAPPATCVQVGLSGALSKLPVDCVVSGINDTLNLGQDVLYSGTVGAAMTAHLLGVPAIAVSLDIGRSGIAHWETAAWGVREIAGGWQKGVTSGPRLYNLNVPNRPVSELNGIQVTRLSANVCLTNYRIAACAENVLSLTPRSDQSPVPPAPGTDAWAVAQGYLSITPLRLFPDVIDGAAWPELARSAPSATLGAMLGAELDMAAAA
jgi:5'-nucleotidase